jgi:protein TonB
VTVLPEGAALNGVPMADAALAAALAPLMPAAGAPVIVRPGEGVALQRLVDVIEALEGGGEAAGQRGRAEAAGAGEAARAAWAAAVRARIERAKAWPQGAAGASGRVALIIRIGADGRLLGAVVAQGSGDAALDAAAVAAVRRAAPFPPAPAGVPGAAFRLTIRFDR